MALQCSQDPPLRHPGLGLREGGDLGSESQHRRTPKLPAAPPGNSAVM